MRLRRFWKARTEKASGSGKLPNENEVTSTQSPSDLSSHTPGMRIGKWSL